MTILHVIPSVTVQSGGTATTLANVIRTLNLVGIRAEVLTLPGVGTPLQLEAEVKVAAASFPARFSNSKEAVAWYEQNQDRFDLVVFHSTWTLLNIRVAAAARRAGKPYAVVAHGSLDPFDLQKKARFKAVLGPRWVREYLAGSEGVICATQRESDLLETYEARPRRFVVPWPIEPVAANESREAVRQRYGLGADEFVVLSLGRVDYKKGFPILIPAFRRLLDAGVKARLLIVGPDSHGYLAKVKAMVAAERMGDATVFIDTITGAAKSSLMAASDCFALPSLNENFGNVVVEAMQCGLPVVVSDNVYIADQVAEAGAGIVCRYDVDSVAEGLKRLATDAPACAAMGVAAREGGAGFRAEALKEEYRDVFETVCARRKAEGGGRTADVGGRTADVGRRTAEGGRRTARARGAQEIGDSGIGDRGTADVGRRTAEGGGRTARARGAQEIGDSGIGDRGTARSAGEMGDGRWEMERRDAAEGRRGRGAWGVILVCLLAYGAGFFWRYPGALLISDEGRYVQQASVFAEGRLHADRIDPFTGDTVRAEAPQYSPGTALLMAPFIRVGGERAAHLLSLLSLVAAVLLTARWLRESGLRPEFALLLLLYPPTLVMGRVCMSDVPSLALVALFLWLFFRGVRENAGGAAFVAGGLIGIAALVRETNPALLLPFALGTAWRRDATAKAHWAGVLLGFAVCVGVNFATHDSAAPRSEEVGSCFALTNIVANLPLAGVSLLVFMPLGAVWMARFRHARKPEFLAAYLACLGVYLLWCYNGSESGLVRGLILGGRFYLPLLPIVAFATAQRAQRAGVGRWEMGARGAQEGGRRTAEGGGQRAEDGGMGPDGGSLGPEGGSRMTDAGGRAGGVGLRTSGRGGRTWRERCFNVGYVVAGLGLPVVCFASHAMLDRLTQQAVAIRRVYDQQALRGGLVITNREVADKYLQGALESRRVVDIYEVDDPRLPELLRAVPELTVVLLYRSDAPYWTTRSEKYDQFLARVRERVALREVAEERLSPALRMVVLTGAGGRAGDRGMEDRR